MKVNVIIAILIKVLPSLLSKKIEFIFIYIISSLNITRPNMPLCLRVLRDSQGRQLRDSSRFLVNWSDEGVLHARCYFSTCSNEHDSDYYCGSVLCYYYMSEKRCSSERCMRFHTPQEVREMAERLKSSPKLLNFLEIMTPEQFRMTFSLEEQQDYYDKLKMKRSYKPVDFSPVALADRAPLLPTPAPAPALATATMSATDIGSMLEILNRQQEIIRSLMPAYAAPISGFQFPALSSSSSLSMPPIPSNFPTYLTGSLLGATSSHSTIIPPLPPPPAGYATVSVPVPVSDPVPDRSHLSDAAKRIILQGINRSASDRIYDRGWYPYSGASGSASGDGASGSGASGSGASGSGASGSGASGGGAYGGGASGSGASSSTSQRSSEPGEIADSSIWYFDRRDMKMSSDQKIVVQKRDRSRSRERKPR